MNENRLKDMIKGEMDSIKEIISAKRKEIEKIQFDIKYYEGQKDILEYVIKTIDTFKDEK